MEVMSPSSASLLTFLSSPVPLFDDVASANSFSNPQTCNVDSGLLATDFLFPPTSKTLLLPEKSSVQTLVTSRPVPTLQLPPKLSKKTAPQIQQGSTSTVAGWETCVADNIVRDVQEIVTTLKKRGEGNVFASEEKLLYQPYRYQLVTEVGPQAFAGSVQALLYRVQVVDAESDCDILKNSTTILQAGEGFQSLQPAGAGTFKGEMRVLFLDCSYHHSNRPFALKVSYYLNNQLDKPILVRKSPAFRVIARPPEKKRKTSEKRKRAEDQEKEPSPKKQKTAQSAEKPSNKDACQTFLSAFQSLMETSFKNLGEQEKKRAVEFMMLKLYEQTQVVPRQSLQDTNDEMAVLQSLLQN
jgi:hypothetical protein